MISLQRGEVRDIPYLSVKWGVKGRVARSQYHQRGPIFLAWWKPFSWNSPEWLGVWRWWRGSVKKTHHKVKEFKSHKDDVDVVNCPSTGHFQGGWISFWAGCLQCLCACKVFISTAVWQYLYCTVQIRNLYYPCNTRIDSRCCFRFVNHHLVVTPVCVVIVKNLFNMTQHLIVFPCYWGKIRPSSWFLLQGTG